MIDSETIYDTTRQFLTDCSADLDSEDYDKLIENGYNFGLSKEQWKQVYSICENYLNVNLTSYAIKFIHKSVADSLRTWMQTRSKGIRITAFNLVYLGNNTCGLTYELFLAIVRREVAKIPELYIEMEAGFNIIKKREVT